MSFRSGFYPVPQSVRFNLAPWSWRPVVTLAATAALIWAVATLIVLGFPWLRWPVVLVAAFVQAPLAYALVRRQWSLQAPDQPPGAAAEPAGGLVDEVTRSLNRRGISSSLIEAMAQSQRYGSPLSAVSLGVDHIAGEAPEESLSLVAAVLGEALRLPDRFGRYDEDEFLLVLPQTRADDAMGVAERLRQSIITAVARAAGPGPVPLTVSFGVAEFGKGQDLEKFVGSARNALATARASGGGQVAQFRATRARR